MKTLLALFFLAVAALAKTDLAGCTSSAQGASLVYWVPETGEICSILDCGGGRAPSYTPSYLPGWSPNGGPTTTSSAEGSSYAPSWSTSTRPSSPSSPSASVTYSSSSLSSTVCVTIAPSTTPMPVVTFKTGTGITASTKVINGSVTTSAIPAAATFSGTASAVSGTGHSLSGRWYCGCCCHVD